MKLDTLSNESNIPLNFLGCDSHKHSRDLADYRWNLLCGGSRICQAEGVQLQDRHGSADCHAHIAGTVWFESFVLNMCTVIFCKRKKEGGGECIVRL